MKKQLWLAILVCTFLFACNKEEPPVICIEPPVSSFSISGFISDPAGNKLKGILVSAVLMETASGTVLYMPNEHYTSIDHGMYFYTIGIQTPRPEFHISLYFRDIDGEENGGKFKTQIIDIPLDLAKYQKVSETFYKYEKDIVLEYANE